MEENDKSSADTVAVVQYKKMNQKIETALDNKLDRDWRDNVHIGA